MALFKHTKVVQVELSAKQKTTFLVAIPKRSLPSLASKGNKKVANGNQFFMKLEKKHEFSQICP